MRIISGRFGGRKLRSFRAKWIRPTSDVVKGSIFNKLQGQVTGACVLDLFSGTGNLSLEALSRGAVEVTAVESHPGSIKIIRENAAELKIENELIVLSSDVFGYLARADLSKYDLVLIDPPFTAQCADRVMQKFSENASYSNDVTIVIESSRQEFIGNQYANLIRFDLRDFGDKRVSYFKPKC